MANWVGWTWVCIICLPLAVMSWFCNNFEKVPQCSKPNLRRGVIVGYPKVKLWKQIGNVLLMLTGWFFVFPFVIFFPFLYLLRLCLCSCCIWTDEDGIHDLGIYNLESIRRHKSCMEQLEFQFGIKVRGQYNLAHLVEKQYIALYPQWSTNCIFS